MSLNGLSEDTTISAGDGLSLSTAGVMTAEVTQAELDSTQGAISAGTGLSFSGLTLNAEVTQSEVDAKQNEVTAGAGLSFSGATLNAEVTQSEVDAKQDTLTFNAPSSNNGNPATSAQIKTALDAKQNSITAGDNLSFSGNVLNAAAAMPTGSILPYTNTSAPSGYLNCDGSEVSRTTYSALFSVCGTSYGAGNGSSTFNVPDLRNQFIRGASFSLALGTVQADATAVNGLSVSIANDTHDHSINIDNDTHNHSISRRTVQGNSWDVNEGWGGSAGNFTLTTSSDTHDHDGDITSDTHNHTATVTGDSETRPQCVVVHFMIKT